MRNLIDFEKPSHQLDDVLFDVISKDVFTTNLQPDGAISTLQQASNYKAVVNKTNGHILSVVGDNYQLISNREALEMGKDIFTQLYPNIKRIDLIPYKVVAPQTMGSVHIDLIHKDVNFKVFEQDTWLPFLRTTNSYNRSVALSFEIGFVRKLCSNGVLFDKKSIKLKYLHNKGNSVNVIHAANQIKTTSVLFSDQCQSLKNYEIPEELMFALVCQILNINLELPKENQIRKKMNSLENLIGLTKILTTRYAKEMGSNAYSAFNVVTDLISHQDQYKNLTGFYFNVRSYYSKPTDWMYDFSNHIKEVNFDYFKYLKDTIESLERIRKQAKFIWELN